jgi:SagB-type dehydrogenase family enzyme
MDILQKRTRKDFVKLLYDTPDLVAEIYHEASKLNEANARSFRRRIQKIIGPEFFLKIIAQGYKTYPASDTVALPPEKECEQPELAQDLRKIISRRRSVRAFSGRHISAANLSTLLSNSYGITGRFHLPFEIEQKVRSVPSGGALFPLEIYVGAFRVDGIEPGIYHYNMREHCLELVRPGLFEKELGAAFFYEEMFTQISVAVIITGILRRSSLKYGERSYRFMTLEAGHVGQNLCLSASSLELGCVMLGGFMDDDVNRIIEVDGVDEFTLYGAAIGRTK